MNFEYPLEKIGREIHNLTDFKRYYIFFDIERIVGT